jgi:hypothetical protein
MNSNLNVLSPVLELLWAIKDQEGHSCIRAIHKLTERKGASPFLHSDLLALQKSFLAPDAPGGYLLGRDRSILVWGQYRFPGALSFEPVGIFGRIRPPISSFKPLSETRIQSCTHAIPIEIFYSFSPDPGLDACAILSPGRWKDRAQAPDLPLFNLNAARTRNLDHPLKSMSGRFKTHSCEEESVRMERNPAGPEALGVRNQTWS